MRTKLLAMALLVLAIGAASFTRDMATPKTAVQFWNNSVSRMADAGYPELTRLSLSQNGSGHIAHLWLPQKFQELGAPEVAELFRKMATNCPDWESIGQAAKAVDESLPHATVSAGAFSDAYMLAWLERAGWQGPASRKPVCVPGRTQFELPWQVAVATIDLD